MKARPHNRYRPRARRQQASLERAAHERNETPREGGRGVNTTTIKAWPPTKNQGSERLLRVSA
jgi:hypothetical protein